VREHLAEERRPEQRAGLLCAHAAISAPAGRVLHTASGTHASCHVSTPTYHDLGDDEGHVGAAEQGVHATGEREDGADMVEEEREVELERVIAGSC
jgi:hypothetical protein